MHFHEISILRTRVLKIFILLSVEKTIVTSTNLHREKMILNKKVNWLHMVFFIWIPICNSYILQTRHEDLWSFYSLMFCLKLTRELPFFIFAGSYFRYFVCYSFKSAIDELWQLTVEVSRISYVIWDTSQHKYLIDNMDDFLC